MANKKEKKTDKKNLKQVKHKKWIFQSIVALIVIFMITGAVIYAIHVRDDAKRIKYFAFTQVCDVDEYYFETLSVLKYGDINQSYIIDLKSNSGHCSTGESDRISEEEFDKLVCNSIDWNGPITCKEGYRPIEDFCYSIEGNFVTNPMFSCSKYYCQNGTVVELEYPVKE